MRHLLDRHAARVPGAAASAATALPTRGFRPSPWRRAILSGTPYYRAFTTVNFDG
jgi:hypothetical protein